MTDNQFEKIVDKNFDEVVDLIEGDEEFVYNFLRDNSNSDVIFDYANAHRGEVLNYLGLEGKND